MPATRGATQRAEAQRVALLTAASNADAQPLNPELVEIVIKHLPRRQLAGARLVSKQFTAAVDPLIMAVSISRRRLDRRVTPLAGLQHVTRLDVGFDVNVSDQWRQVKHITSQLPKLNTLRSLSALGALPVSFVTSLSSLTRLTRLDMRNVWERNGFTKGVQLPSLKAASFGFPCDVADIAALAPNLEQLYCDSLILDSPAALPACTYFGSSELVVSITAAAAQAFAAAFPNLQVVTSMPCVSHGAEQLSAQQLLAQLPSVYAVRGWLCYGMPGAAAAGPQALPQLQRLCLHGIEDLDIPSISSMTQLQHLRITFPAHEAHDAGETKLQALLHALAALPQLRYLVLPAGLLCSQCCPGVQSSLQGLTAKSSLKQLVFLEWRDPYQLVPLLFMAPLGAKARPTAPTANAPLARMASSQLQLSMDSATDSSGPHCNVLQQLHSLKALRDVMGGPQASGPVFQPHLARGAARALSKTTVAVRLRKALAHIRVGAWRRYAAHSLRRGGATHAAGVGVPLRFNQLMGRWKSDVVREYMHFTPGQVFAASALMLDG